MMSIAGAAAAVDARSFVPGSLHRVAARRDELGHLARTFEVMAEQVLAREEELERQVRERTRELQLKNIELDQAKRRLEADLDMAKLLQSTILPQAFPTDGSWCGTARMTPALQMAGDFYDYFSLDAHRLGLVIADVSGKGVAPAFFMAVSRSALQEAARHNDDPGACLAAANDRLCEQNPLDMFVTVFYAVIDGRNGTVVYANGGHNRPYVVGQDGVPRAVPLTDGIALGVMSGLSYASATLALQAGETLFLYTDGVSEAMNPENEEFGEPRLEAALAQSASLPVEDMLGAVTTSVHDFAGSAPQSDDITCLVVRYLGDRIQVAPQKPAISAPVRPEIEPHFT
jgi:sigma-B regulation protein RsbU (phosphoserine phosphatase)